MIANAADLARLVEQVFGDEVPPRPLDLFWAYGKIQRGRIDVGAARQLLHTTPARLRAFLESPDTALGPTIPVLNAEVEVRARLGLGQLLIGNLAERAFEHLYRARVGTDELELRDDRGARGETDYLVINGQGRQVFRIDIKFHGSLFRRAQDLVGLEPEDCFALATYKIHAALRRQDAEHLPYIFVVVSVPGLTGADVGAAIPEDLVHLAALPRLTTVQRLRDIEDRTVDALVADPDLYNTTAHIREYEARIADARWLVLSARKADLLLRDMLFDRAYALRVRAFARNYRGAELDMHFSMANDLVTLDEFLGILRDNGMPGLVTRLERGTV